LWNESFFSAPQLKRDSLDSTMVFDKLLKRLGEKFRGAPIQRSRDEVIALLENELRGVVSAADWDEFQSLSIADPELDSVRQLVPLEGQHSAEGRAIIERCLAKLRGRAV
jgi:hypothetical protein